MTFSEKILESAQEGIVLLRNNENTLPLAENETVSVFGRCQFDFYKCGMGSGGSVRSPYSTTLTDNIPSANKALAEIYRNWIKENPFDNAGGGWAMEPYFQKELPVTKELAEKAAAVSGKAVFVIGRNAGEDKDLNREKGCWLLTDEERASIKNVCAAFESVIIVFNTCGIIDTQWIDDAEFAGKIKSVVYAWQGGQESGRACANILCGKSVPCGKLTDTIAKSIDDYPSTKNFASPDEAFYKEDIYVGYRYFSTFAKNQILFPFGFGLSYTEFKTELVSSDCDGKNTNVKVRVKNTGKKFSGKEIVQLYVQAPQGKLGKPEKVLAAFAKTQLLNPGESEELELSFNLESAASYDDSGATGFPYSFVLEKGEYRVLMGTDSESAKEIPVGPQNFIFVEQTYAVEKLCQALAPQKEFSRIRPGKKNSDGTFSILEESVPLEKFSLEQRIQQNLPAEIPFTGDLGIKFSDVKKNPGLLEKFIGQLNSEQLATLVRGEGMMSRKATMGIASVFGGVSQSLYEYGIPVAGCADGPSGIRLDTGKEASLMPIGTQLACTWNTALVQELFEFEGRELSENQIDTVLGPGINIHRNPLNGRNFEYFSEDPLLSGEMAAAILRGISKNDTTATIKHFAANNQETQRREHDSIVSERALREIYLKPFEIAVKKGNARSIMTSYNQINGHFAASNYDLNTTILRENWKYTGLVMTDWWARMNDCVKGGKGEIELTASMVRARNDVYMIANNDEAEKDGNNDNIKASLKNGTLTIAELQICARDILQFLLEAPVSKRQLRPLNNIPVFTSKAEQEESGKNPAQENTKFLCHGETKRMFFAPEAGIYNIIGTYSKPAESDKVSQSVCNVLIDGTPVSAFECRTTEGKETSAVIGQVQLAKGMYEISLSHTKPGITMHFVALSRSISVSSAVSMLKSE
ncbi:glycoside hydrolase family 3 protein [Treponema sp.]|uniref:glycoside hydrolase family 3 protein n=1 Tax=Treponema sp. TaxID=166 RepID=UPI003F084D1F